MNLNGKRVLITGGSSGIGLASALELGRCGARLVISGRRAEALAAAQRQLREAGVEAVTVQADVATDAGRQATLDAALQALGGLDVLVNNAGGVRAGPLDTMSGHDIRAMIDVDLLAPVLLTQQALPALRAGGDAMVVNVASGLALIGAPFYAVYAAAKAGLARFGEALRRELKGEGVHVLTVYPGATETPMMATSRAGAEHGFTFESAEAVAQALVAGMQADAFEVIRGGEARQRMIALNRDDPAAVDERFRLLKPALAEAVKDHSAL